MRPLLHWTLLGVMISFASAGCTSVKRPGVAVRDVTVSGVTSEGFVLDFAVELTNPNREPLDLDEVAYDLRVNGQKVYDGRRSAEAALAAGGGKTITIPAVVRFDQIGATEVPPSMTYSFSGRLWYLAESPLAEILFDSGVRRPSVGFGTEGDLKMADGG